MFQVGWNKEDKNPDAFLLKLPARLLSLMGGFKVYLLTENNVWYLPWFRGNMLFTNGFNIYSINVLQTSFSHYLRKISPILASFPKQLYMIIFL
ncbi:hypothetical protein ACFL0D_01255 [Thermoproteota archaeon]